ncbi:MAG TPA: 3-deoxy-D-manno-octulosonic acid transferase, partial [Pedobacter sp.]
IIAPHEVTTTHIHDLMKWIPGAVKYTTLENGQHDPNCQVLIIDNIGMLSSVYQYGKIAYIGGGFGTGIHNTLEAAAFGLPVIFGPEYDKFQEAKDLLALHAAISISSAEELYAAFEKLHKDKDAGNTAKKYVLDKTGATAQIIEYLENCV